MAKNHFDAYYGIASAGISTTGFKVIATTAAGYHGLAVVGGTVNCIITVYDNSSTTSGNILDIILVTGTAGEPSYDRVDKVFPVQARLGITAKMEGTGATGTIFYSPKG